MRGSHHLLVFYFFWFLSGEAQKLIERNSKLMNIFGSEANY